MKTDCNRPSIVLQHEDDPNRNGFVSFLNHAATYAAKGILPFADENGVYSFKRLIEWSDYVSQIRGNAAVWEEGEFWLVLGSQGVLHVTEDAGGGSCSAVWLTEEHLENLDGQLPESWEDFREAYGLLQAMQDPNYPHRAGVGYSFQEIHDRLREEGYDVRFGGYRD